MSKNPVPARRRRSPTKGRGRRPSPQDGIGRQLAELKLAIYNLVARDDAFGLRPVAATGNAFCPTGPGGGVDPSCSPSGGGGFSSAAGVSRGVIPDAPRTSIPGHDTFRNRVTPPEQVTGVPKTKKARQELARGLQAAHTEVRNALVEKYGTRDIEPVMTPEERALDSHLFFSPELIHTGRGREGPTDLGPVADEHYARHYKNAVRALDRLRQLAAQPPGTYNIGGALNAFCPTGLGGGVDPSCSPGGEGGWSTKVPAKTDKDGRNIYAGIHENDWEQWAYESDNINAALNGKLKAGEPLAGGGGNVTAKDIIEFKGIGEKINAAAQKYGTPQKVLYRGTSFASGSEADAAFPVGKEVVARGLVATSPSQETAAAYAHVGEEGEGVPVILEYKSQVGHRGVYTAPLGMPEKDLTKMTEGEFIMPRGSRYVVTGKSVDAKGIRRVTLEPGGVKETSPTTAPQEKASPKTGAGLPALAPGNKWIKGLEGKYFTKPGSSKVYRLKTNQVTGINAFCPTGPGGGVDPSCSPSGAGGGSIAGSLSAHLDKTLDSVLSHTPYSREQLAGGLGTDMKMRATVAGSILLGGTAVPDALTHLGAAATTPPAVIAAITKGDPAGPIKELSTVPAHDVAVLNGISASSKPVQGEAICNMGNRTIVVGSTTRPGSYRHELGHALRAALGGDSYSGRTAMTKAVSTEYAKTLDRMKADPGGLKGDHPPEHYEEKYGLVSRRCKDNFEEYFAEHYRVYHRERYRDEHEGGEGERLANYRKNNPGMAKVFDAHYTTALLHEHLKSGGAKNQWRQRVPEQVVANTENSLGMPPLPGQDSIPASYGVIEGDLIVEYAEEIGPDDDLYWLELYDQQAEADTYGDGGAGLVAQAFCPTGPGGRIDPTCSPGRGGQAHTVESIDARMKKDYGSRIPSDWSIRGPVSPESGEGCAPHQCQTNAVEHARQSGYKVVAGIAVEKASFADDQLYTFHHVWNEDDKGRVVDVTLGTKEAKKYIYVGKQVPDKIKDSPTKIDGWIYDEQKRAKGRKRPTRNFSGEATNSFCPTGPGGGVDPSCSPGGGHGASPGAPAAGTKGVVGRVLDKIKAIPGALHRLEVSVKAFAADKIAEAVAHLPFGVQEAIHVGYHVAHATTYAAFATWRLGQLAAERVAEERHLPPDASRRLRGVLTALDIATFKPISIGLAAAGLGPAGIAAASFVPPASAAYLAYSTARHPMATLRAAKSIVTGSAFRHEAGHGAHSTAPPSPKAPPRARLEAEELVRHSAASQDNGLVQFVVDADGDPVPTPEALANASLVADALEAHDWDDWYCALFLSALEATSDGQDALRLATDSYDATPKDPSDPADDDAEALFGPAPPELTDNTFCPTGPGGGVDPRCSPGGEPPPGSSAPVTVEELRSLLPPDPATGRLGTKDVGALTVRGYRVGSVSDAHGRGIYLSGDQAGAEQYSVLHPGQQVKEYTLHLDRVLLAGHQNDVTKLLFGKSYGEVYSGGVDAGRRADVRVAKELKRRGYDGLVLLKPAPPATTEIAVFKKSLTANKNQLTGAWRGLPEVWQVLEFKEWLTPRVEAVSIDNLGIDGVVVNLARTLADGLARGASPSEIGRDLVGELDSAASDLRKSAGETRIDEGSSQTPLQHLWYALGMFDLAGRGETQQPPRRGVANAFCPTGPGGGPDNSCPPRGRGTDAPGRGRIGTGTGGPAGEGLLSRSGSQPNPKSPPAPPPTSLPPGVAPQEEQAAARAAAERKISRAPVPSPDEVAKARAEMEKARAGEGRPGGEARGGNAADRRRQRENLFKEFGGDERGYVVCPWTGIKMHHTDDPTANPNGYPLFERGKIFTKCQGGGYNLPNLLPESFAANRARNDKRLRSENSSGC